MNHAPRLQTTARANELVEQYNRESANPFSRRPLTGHPLRLHYWEHITRANREGFTGLAGVLVELYHKRFPNPT